MDEFLPYHVLACHQPGQHLNALLEGCSDYPTRLGPLEFQRAYHYTGVTSSILLWPLFGAVPSLLVAFVPGLVALALVALGLTRSLALPARRAWLVGCFLPVTFSLLHDTGPVRVGLVVLAWSPVVVRRALAAESPWRALAWGAVLAAAWLVATEDKPFFVFLLPGAALWCLAALHLTGAGELVRERLRRAVGVLGTSAAACVALLGVLQANGVPYVTYLRTASREVPSHSLTERFQAAAAFTVSWVDYGGRVRDLRSAGVLGVDGLVSTQGWTAPSEVGPGSPAWTLMLLCALATTGLLLLAASRLLLAKRTARAGAVLLLGAFVALTVGAVLSGGWFGHHYVYAQVPLLAAVLLATSRPWEHWAAALGVGVLSVLSLLAMSQAPTYPWASPDVWPALEAAHDQPGEAVLSCASWGCYYPAALEARKDRPVLYAPIPGAADDVLDVARGRRADVIHLCWDCSASDVSAYYRGSAVTPIPTRSRSWLVFRVVPAPA